MFYIDVRTPGKNYDEFYRRAVEEYGVHYIKGMVGKVVPRSDGKLMVQASDLMATSSCTSRPTWWFWPRRSSRTIPRDRWPPC